MIPCISIQRLLLMVMVLLCISRAGAAEELVIVGTGSGVPLLEAVGKAFTAHNPDIVIVIPESIGSGGGIKAVGHDEYTLGRVARDIHGNEAEYGLDQMPLAKMPIVFFVNDSVRLSGITYKQACDIYAGTVRTWDEIGGGQGKTRVINREEGDSSLIVLLNTVPGFRDITFTPRSKITFTDQETVDACRTQENAIAYGSWSDVRNIKGIRVLKLGGVDPVDPAYAHIGFLSLIYKEKNRTGSIKKFIDFISTDVARKAIAGAGGVPVK